MALPNGDLITTVFDPQMAYPVDKRMQVDTLNSRDSMSMFIRWEGMEVYVLENSKKYILQGGRSNEYWKENGTGSGTGGTTFVGQFETDDLLPTSGRSAGDYAFVGTGEDFVQYNWDSIANEWVMAEGQTDLASEHFHIGYKTPLRRPVIFRRDPKDVIIDDSGDIIIDTNGEAANFILTGEVESVIGIVSATDGREIHLTNRTGSDVLLVDEYTSTDAENRFNIGSDYTLSNGETISLKSEDDRWVLGYVNQVAFSDHLDSVGAVRSTGPDGLEVIYNVKNRYTGHTENFKEIQFIPTIVDGNIFKQIGSKYLKRVFTTPIDLESVGVKYNDESAAALNMTLISLLLNLGQPVCIKNKVYITPNLSEITFPKIFIYGDNEDSELSIAQEGTNSIFLLQPEIDTFSIKDLKINIPSGTAYFFQKNDTDYKANLISFKNVEIHGDVRIRVVGKLDNTNTKINKIEILDSIFHNSNRFIQITNCFFDSFNIERNQVNNFLGTFITTSVTNSHVSVGVIVRGMKILRAIGNVVINDENTYETTETGSAYHAFILTETLESHYINNHVEGIKAVVPKELYDIYQSSITSVYKDNTYKNNICFTGGPSAGMNTLYKGKGGLYKRIQNNQFIIEEDFLRDFIDDHPEYSLSLDNCKVSYASFESNPKRVFYEDNIINVYHLRNEGANNSRDYEFHFNRNTIHANIIDSVPFVSIGMDTSLGADRHYSFEGNKILKKGDEESSIIHFSDQFNASDPALPVDFISLKINNNYVKGFNVRAVFATRFSELEINNNTIDCRGAANGPSTLLYAARWDASVFGTNNLFITDNSIYDYSSLTGLKNVTLSTEYRITQSRIAVGSGYYFYKSNYNYSLKRTYEISSIDYGETSVSVYLDHLFDGVDSYIKYTVYEDDTEYDVKIEPSMTMGNGSSSHILLRLIDESGSSYGEIRLYANNGVPRLSLNIPVSNYTIKISDNVQD